MIRSLCDSDRWFTPIHQSLGHDPRYWRFDRPCYRQRLTELLPWILVGWVSTIQNDHKMPRILWMLYDFVASM